MCSIATYKEENEMTDNNDNQKYILQSVSNALDIIDIIGQNNKLTITEIVNLSGQNKSSVFRILATLEAKNYVNCDSSKKYSLGNKFAYLGMAYNKGSSFLTYAHPHLEEMMHESGETTHLAVLENSMYVTFIDKVVSTASIHMDSHLGFRRYAHLVGCGKAILASSDESLIGYYLRNADFTPLTEHSISTPEKFAEELTKIRKNGYSIDDEESENGLVCAAAPILGLDGKPIAAMSISGPASRMKENMCRNIGIIKTHAAAISESLQKIS